MVVLFLVRAGRGAIGFMLGGEVVDELSLALSLHGLNGSLLE